MDKKILPSSKSLMMPLLEFAADGKKLIELYKKIVLTAILAIATATVAMAQVGTEFYDNNSKLYFRVTSVSPNMVEVIKDPYNYSNYTGDIDIPSSVTDNGADYSVTSIGERAFERCSSLTSINIPNSVTAIGDVAFSGCSSLKSVDIPNSVTAIGSSAFYECSSLTSINIPNSVTEIGYYAFTESGIADINVDSSNPRFTSDNGILFSKNMDTIICYPQGKTNSTYTIPGSVTTIGIATFYGCSSLTTVNIPNSVTEIGIATFYRCSSLTTVNIPNSVTKIGNAVFNSCSSLTSINIPNSVTEIGDYAFAGSGIADINVGSSNPRFASDDGILFSKNMDTIICYPPGKTNSTYTIPGSVTTIGIVAFYFCGSLTSIDIPNSITAIGERAFAGCSSLTSVNIPNSVTTIGDYAFGGCSNLTSVNIPNSVTTIGNGVFEACSSLTSIDIPNSVTKIGDVAFWDCTKLTSVNIGNSVETIGNYAFVRCISLRKIKIDVTNPASITLGYNVFMSIPKGASADACILLVPPGSVPAYGDAPQWSEFMPNIFEPQNFTITYNQPAGGTLAILNAADNSSTPSGSQVEHGTIIKIVATPDNGYHLSHIVVNDEPFTGTDITVETDTYIYVEFAQGTGIDHSDYTALSIYPTLAGEYITVATEVGSSPVSVTVTDLSGHTVATAIATGSKTVINISHLSAGTYIVRIGDKVGKVVKR